MPARSREENSLNLYGEKCENTEERTEVSVEHGGERTKENVEHGGVT